MAGAAAWRWARCCCCRPPMRPATNVAEDQPSHHGATASRPTQQRNDKQRMRRAKLRSLPPVPLPMGRSDHCSSLLPFHAATVSLIKGAVECQTRSRLRVRRMQGPSEGASRRGLCRGGVGRVKRGGWRARAEAKTIFVWTGRKRFFFGRAPLSGMSAVRGAVCSRSKRVATPRGFYFLYQDLAFTLHAKSLSCGVTSVNPH